MKRKIMALCLSMALLAGTTSYVVVAAENTEGIQANNNAEMVLPEVVPEVTPETGTQNQNVTPDVWNGASGEYHGSQWSLTKDGVFTITGTGSLLRVGGPIMAPWEEYSDKITKFIVRGFYDIQDISSFRNLKEVVLEDSVEVIQNCFYECPNLMKVSIPTSVHFIRSGSFAGTPYQKNQMKETGLFIVNGILVSVEANRKNVVIPNSVVDISLYAFRNSSVENVVIPESMHHIPRLSFAYCKTLSKVTIPNSVKSIGYEAFAECTNLVEVVLPPKVDIDPSAFRGTPFYENAIKEHGLFIFNNVVIDCKDGIEEVVVPNGVIGIAESAFFGKKSLKKVVLPEGLKRIGEYAFAFSNLQSINIPSSVEEIGYEAFRETPWLKAKGLFIHNNKVIASDTTGTTMIIPNGVTSIEYGAINGCEQLVSVEIPETLTTIKTRGVYDTGLKSITIPKGVTVMEPYSVGYGLGNRPVQDFVIYGYTGSVAETYARENKFKFVSIGSAGTQLPPQTPQVNGLYIVPELTDEIYIKGVSDGLVIYCTGELNKFISVQMDGVIVSPENYTLRDGSTVLTFTSAYMETLAIGRHKVTMNYLNGSASTYITIIKSGVNENNHGQVENGATKPNSQNNQGNVTNNQNQNMDKDKQNNSNSNSVKTGDESSVGLYVVLCLVSAAGCLTILKRRKTA